MLKRFVPLVALLAAACPPFSENPDLSASACPGACLADMCCDPSCAIFGAGDPGMPCPGFEGHLCVFGPGPDLGYTLQCRKGIVLCSGDCPPAVGAGAGGMD